MQLERFQMIDQVETLDLEENRISCRAVVPAESPVFAGHFPGNPLLPGVLMVETMAQAAGYLILARNGFARMPLLAQVERAKLRDFVPPRAVLISTAELLHEGSGFAVARAELARDGKRVADAELRFRTMPFPSDALRALLIDAARRAGLELDANPGEASLGA